MIAIGLVCAGVLALMLFCGVTALLQQKREDGTAAVQSSPEPSVGPELEVFRGRTDEPLSENVPFWQEGSQAPGQLVPGTHVEKLEDQKLPGDRPSALDGWNAPRVRVVDGHRAGQIGFLVEADLRNANGHAAPSPAPAPAPAPARASVHPGSGGGGVCCCDGTRSPTCVTAHRGCCSHHGGVCGC